MILLYLPQARKPGREIIDSYEPRISDACGHSCTSKDCQLGPEFHSNPLIVLNISSKYQNFNEIDFHKFSVESVWWCVNCNIPNVVGLKSSSLKHWSILWSEEPWNQRMLLRPRVFVTNELPSVGLPLLPRLVYESADRTEYLDATSRRRKS